MPNEYDPHYQFGQPSRLPERRLAAYPAQSGPCAVCGATNYGLSYGGPMICPSCDCGPPNARRVREERERLNAESARLRERVAELEVAAAIRETR